MSKHIHLFDTVSAYTEEYNTNYLKPWLSYTLDHRKVNFNKRYIQFADPEVERLCMEYFSSDGKIREGISLLQESC